MLFAVPKVPKTDSHNESPYSKAVPFLPSFIYTTKDPMLLSFMMPVCKAPTPPHFVHQVAHWIKNFNVQRKIRNHTRYGQAFSRMPNAYDVVKHKKENDASCIKRIFCCSEASFINGVYFRMDMLCHGLPICPEDAWLWSPTGVLLLSPYYLIYWTGSGSLALDHGCAPVSRATGALRAVTCCRCHEMKSRMTAVALFIRDRIPTNGTDSSRD